MKMEKKTQPLLLWLLPFSACAIGEREGHSTEKKIKKIKTAAAASKSC